MASRQAAGMAALRFVVEWRWPLVLSAALWAGIGLAAWAAVH